jgi:flavin-dependent dehydrogenase
MMLENAREHGVRAHEGARVVEVLFEDGRACGAVVDTDDGRRFTVRARVVVDASGQAGVIQHRFGLRVWDPVLDKSAVWTYWRGAYRDTGKNEGATMVLQTADRKGWFWYIPLHDDLVSVGVVAPSKLLLRGRGTPERIYTEEVEKCPAVRQRIAGARREAGYFVTKDYSYRAKQAAGEGWVMIGDAYAFLDPLYSSGVLLALRSGEMAADAIVDGLAKGDVSAERLARWRPTFDQGVDRMRRLVCEYYDGFSFGQFVRRYPDLRGTLTDLLIGDLFTDRVDRVWQPMESLYPPDKPAIPAWNDAPRAADADTVERVNELVVPVGPRPV